MKSNFLSYRNLCSAVQGLMFKYKVKDLCVDTRFPDAIVKVLEVDSEGKLNIVKGLTSDLKKRHVYYGYHSKSKQQQSNAWKECRTTGWIMFPLYLYYNYVRAYNAATGSNKSYFIWNVNEALSSVMSRHEKWEVCVDTDYPDAVVTVYTLTQEGKLDMVTKQVKDITDRDMYCPYHHIKPKDNNWEVGRTSDWISERRSIGTLSRFKEYERAFKAATGKER